MLEVIGQRFFRDSLGTWYGNICKTKTGKLVTYRGAGYREFNLKTGMLRGDFIRV